MQVSLSSCELSTINCNRGEKGIEELSEGIASGKAIAISSEEGKLQYCDKMNKEIRVAVVDSEPVVGHGFESQEPFGDGLSKIILNGQHLESSGMDGIVDVTSQSMANVAKRWSSVAGMHLNGLNLNKASGIVGNTSIPHSLSNALKDQSSPVGSNDSEVLGMQAHDKTVVCDTDSRVHEPSTANTMTLEHTEEYAHNNSLDHNTADLARDTRPRTTSRSSLEDLLIQSLKTRDWILQKIKDDISGGSKNEAILSDEKGQPQSIAKAKGFELLPSPESPREPCQEMKDDQHKNDSLRLLLSPKQDGFYSSNGLQLQSTNDNGDSSLKNVTAYGLNDQHSMERGIAHLGSNGCTGNVRSKTKESNTFNSSSHTDPLADNRKESVSSPLDEPIVISKFHRRISLPAPQCQVHWRGNQMASKHDFPSTEDALFNLGITIPASRYCSNPNAMNPSRNAACTKGSCIHMTFPGHPLHAFPVGNVIHANGIDMHNENVHSGNHAYMTSKSGNEHSCLAFHQSIASPSMQSLNKKTGFAASLSESIDNCLKTMCCPMTSSDPNDPELSKGCTESAYAATKQSGYQSDSCLDAPYTKQSYLPTPNTGKSIPKSAETKDLLSSLSIVLKEVNQTTIHDISLEEIKEAEHGEAIEQEQKFQEWIKQMGLILLLVCI